MPSILTIANQKGGEGKTTTALNLAHGLTLKNESKVLLIDMDPQGNTSGIFIELNEMKFSAVDLFLGRKKINKIIVPTKYPNLEILPSKINLAEIEFTSLNVEAPYILRDALNTIQDNYDYIVIDCPPSLSIFTINALVASTHVVIPLQAEKFSLDGIKGLQNTIESIKRRINSNLRILGALITQLKSNTVLTRKILPIIENFFPVFKTTISAGVSIGESHLMKKTVLDYNSEVKQAKEYFAFIEEIRNVL